MIKTTQNYTQENFFAESLLHTDPDTFELLNKKNAWFNVFHSEITAKIDEEKFRFLFDEYNLEIPSASIRSIIAIIILKDCIGISDKQLFEEIICDLRYKKAIGLSSIYENFSSEQIYYLLRRMICKYKVETGINLIQECFKNNEDDLLCTFDINGKNIMIDRKLIGNNIFLSFRYELIHKIFTIHVKPLLSLLNPSLRKQAEEIINRNSQDDQYRLNNSDIENFLFKMGVTLQNILVKIKASEDHILRRLFNEQFTTKQGRAQLKNN